MNPGSPRRNFLVWAALGLTTVTLLLAFWLTNLKSRTVPARALPVYGQVADFSLTNQEARAVSLADLHGHVWVADIIFTRCPGPCLKMTRQMKDLQNALPPGTDARLVTLTTDPDYDSPAILKAYAQRFSADTNRWMFLTGSKQQIADLAIHSLKLTAIEKKPEERESAQDLFVHSTIYVLVDKKAQLRGVFETTGEDINPQEVQRHVLAGIAQLERE
jgi:protein SCO1/2